MWGLVGVGSQASYSAGNTTRRHKTCAHSLGNNEAHRCCFMRGGRTAGCALMAVRMNGRGRGRGHEEGARA
jgi:hypothetical protein